MNDEPIRTFDELMGHLQCPACKRAPHPDTSDVLTVGDWCDWSDCGLNLYVDTRTEDADVVFFTKWLTGYQVAHAFPMHPVERGLHLGKLVRMAYFVGLARGRGAKKSKEVGRLA
jgi:hypothetical protein